MVSAGAAGQGGPCPNGSQFAARPSGGYTPGFNVCGVPTQTYTACPDGTFVPNTQACALTTQILTACPDGSYVTSGQTCPGLTAGFTSCPNGTYVAFGQVCPGTTPSYGTCPNGSYVPSGSICPSGGLGYCSNPYATPGYCAPSGGTATVTYAAGWNIVAGPSGTVDSGSASQLYSFPPGSVSYQTLPQGSVLQAGTGYWAYFNAPVTVTLPAGGPGSTTLQIPPGQPTLVGNPGYGTATVSGSGVTLFVYSPATGSYQQTTQLAAGQGAWAMSTVGGPITITASGAPGAYPPGAYPPGGPPPPPPF
jgi:hypothetical protein